MSLPAKKTILLVEDEIIIALGNAIKINDFGYKVIIAKTGEEAVDMALHNENIDLMLVDINLGKGIDGIEASMQILKKRDVPIIFLSSHIEQEYVEKLKNIAHFGYITKNSEDPVLQSSIERAFDLFKKGMTE